jgi:taurine dioxygenase
MSRDSLPQLLPHEGFGAAEIVGLDVGATTDDANRQLVRDALWEHGVVCLRFPRPLDDAEARSVAAMIGPIKDPVGRARDGSALRYGEDRQIIDAGFVLTDELRAELGDLDFGGDSVRPGLFEAFHTVDSYTDEPAAATVLHARDLPKGPGGNTCVIDMRAAFAHLDLECRQRLIGLYAAHSYDNGGAFPPRPAAKGPLAELVDVAHPVVRAHPVTATPALYFDLDRATHVVGMAEAEGRALLQSLQDHAEANGPRYEHAWQPNDVLIWDDASVQHKASGDFPIGEPRRFWRYMIEGGIPIAATAE